MSERLVEISHVTKRFGDFVAVENINLDIGEGEFLAIMGSSGCGKTTTLRMLAGLEAPTSGEIRLHGEPVNDVLPWHRDTPLVWQNLALFPFMNVTENVEFGLRMRGMNRQARRKKAMEWLERLDIAEFATRNVEQLSGGQRQRVALARSLVTEPPMLLLDEPLSALDANLKVRMQAVLTRLQREIGITFVYVTHSQSEAFAMADRVVIMSRGRIEQIGTPREIYNSPVNRFVADFIGGKNIVTGTVLAVEADRVEVQTAQGRFSGHAVGGFDPAPGMNVSICVGADRVALANGSDAPTNRLRATVIGEEFIGTMVTIHLEAAQGLTLQLQQNVADADETPWRAGQEIELAWQADDTLVLPESA